MKPREWAIEIVRVLQKNGHEALFAGGCVRDAILGIEPKDYDVATSATPDAVQAVFGVKRTLAIGKSFGVITVIGPKSAGNIEVATFRRDGGYSDGRRPDSVEFTDSKEDALRRDFTINGMFFDPILENVIDFVGGRDDLQRKRIRAIGDPDSRIEEDRLRMLRGVRFAATYGFEIETATMSAIQKRASDIDLVSPERIGTELRRMFTHQGRARALRLLDASGLWSQVLPSELYGRADWKAKREVLEKLGADFPTTLAGLLLNVSQSARELQDLWRLKNEEVARTDWILSNQKALSTALDLEWSQLQPLLISQHATHAIDLLQALVDSGCAERSCQSSLALCREKLQLEPAQLNPTPLLSGNDLKEIGLQPGPTFKTVLAEVRAMQLDGKLSSSQDARTWVLQSKQ